MFGFSTPWPKVYIFIKLYGNDLCLLKFRISLFLNVCLRAGLNDNGLRLLVFPAETAGRGIQRREPIILDGEVVRGGHMNVGQRRLCDRIVADDDIRVRAAGRDRAIATAGDNIDSDSFAIGDLIVSDNQIAAAARLQPPPFRRDEDGGHPAACQTVADDASIAGLDQDAA